LLQAIRERLEIKILLLITAVLLVGFGTYVIISIQKESRQLVWDHHDKLWIYSETLMAGIRTVMLTGKAPFATELVNDVRSNLKAFGELTMYDRLGREVFLREGEGVLHGAADSLVYRAMRTNEPQWAMRREMAMDVFARYEPLENRRECWRCHNPNDRLRGVLELTVKPDVIRPGVDEGGTRELAALLGDVVTTAFRNIMVGGGGEFMDTLMLTSRNIPTIEDVRVYSRQGDLVFGDEERNDIDLDEIVEIVEAESKEKIFHQRGNLLRLFQPLPNEERCQVCHGTRFPMRGVLVVDFAADSLRMLRHDPVKQATPVFQAALFEGFRGIMLVGRAGSVRYYMDEVRSLPLVRSLRVFDNDGNERFLNPPARYRPETAAMVDTLRAMEFLESVGGEKRLVLLSPLPNEPRCYSCHGRNHTVRGIVEVSASMKEINRAVRESNIRSAVVGLVMILGVWVVLRLFLNSVVVKPVQVIEGVATRVGNGDFSVQAQVNSRDEIGKLAMRINEMVQGLRERLHLQKFVSRQTVDAVRKADLQGVRLGGERKLATVFFSDLRGFTAFSEHMEPERVVAILNAILSKQAAIVRQYGGDIDKFVGDELVAVFEGDEMVDNALRAAVEIQSTVNTSVDAGDEWPLAVGIGINSGEVVMGAMGSEDRMDYTVIGDAVNLGARLCSAARGGQILISEAASRLLRNSESFTLLPLEPMAVKGKAQPIRVFEVQSATA
jgi:adenylate cyclase